MFHLGGIEGMLAYSALSSNLAAPQCLSPCRSRYCPVAPREARKKIATPAINRSHICPDFPLDSPFWVDSQGKPTELVTLSKIQGLARPPLYCHGKILWYIYIYIYIVKYHVRFPLTNIGTQHILVLANILAQHLGPESVRSQLLIQKIGITTIQRVQQRIAATVHSFSSATQVQQLPVILHIFGWESDLSYLSILFKL